jgi:hypothetical protein
MVRDPILIERPIIAGGRAGLGRSPENVKKPAAQFWAPADVACLSLLPANNRARNHVTKPDSFY